MALVPLVFFLLHNKLDYRMFIYRERVSVFIAFHYNLMFITLKKTLKLLQSMGIRTNTIYNYAILKTFSKLQVDTLFVCFLWFTSVWFICCF